MTDIYRLLEKVEDTYVDGVMTVDEDVWTAIRVFIEVNFPALEPIRIGSLYTVNTKKGRVTAVCTKENGKTWVMYEVDGSRSPGSRWMLGKTWCTMDHIVRAKEQSYTIPVGVKFK